MSGIILYQYAECHYPQCRPAECRVAFLMRSANLLYFVIFYEETKILPLTRPGLGRVFNSRHGRLCFSGATCFNSKTGKLIVDTQHKNFFTSCHALKSCLLSKLIHWGIKKPGVWFTKLLTAILRWNYEGIHCTPAIRMDTRTI